MTDSHPDPRDRRILAGILCLALAARCGVVVLRADQLTIDRDAYLGIAENLAAGKGFCTPGTTSPTAYRPPIYPLLVSAAMTVLPMFAAVAVINILAGGITVWLVGRIGAVLGLGPYRHLAAMFVAVDPLLLNATAQPMTEVVFTALVTAWLWAVTRRVEEVGQVDWRWAVLSGALFGFAALCRPTIWPLAGLMGLTWMIPSATRQWRRRDVLRALITISATLLVVAPWVVRNHFVFGKPILTTTHGGYTLLLANNPVYFQEVVQQPWGKTWSGDSLSRWQAGFDQEMQDALGSPPGEAVRDAWMSAKARRYIRLEPMNFFQAMAHRVRCLWSIAPQGEGTSLPGVVRFGVAMFYALEYVAAIVGFGWIARRRQWPLWLPGLLLIVTIQGVHLAYWTDARMRTPLQPVLALLAANAVRRRSGT